MKIILSNHIYHIISLLEYKISYISTQFSFIMHCVPFQICDNSIKVGLDYCVRVVEIVHNDRRYDYDTQNYPYYITEL